MRSSLAWSGLVLALSGALLACGEPPPMDGGTDAPVPMDGDATTPPPPDGTPPADTRADGDAAALCRMIAPEDLNTLGMRMGAVTRYTGNNNMASMSTTAGIQTGGIAVCNYQSTRQRIFTYTLQTRAAIRVSTNNPGTNFDTTIAIAPGCRTADRVIACNDDDPTATPATRNSLTTTDVREMGTTLYIAVGGFVNATMRDPMTEMGNFELTVEELAPLADGMPCDVRGLQNVCGPSSTCLGNTILSDTMGTCRANGTLAGTRCATGSMCTGPNLMCDTMNGRCFETVADGMPCQRFTDAWQRCGATSTCVNLQRGNLFGVCRANGSVAGAACNAMNMCTGAGLSCQITATGSICLGAVTTGAACRTWDELCPMNEQCVATNVGGTPGTCRPIGGFAGTDCAAGAMCTAPLTCTPRGMAQVCTSAGTTGMACGVYTQCEMMGTCYLNDPASRITGLCYAAGALGGPCTSPTACGAGLVCSNAMATPDNPGRCLTMGTVGGACRIFGTVQCPMGSTCVPGMPTSLDGTCVAEGGRGAACRAMGARCDAGLTCTTMTGAGICQAAAAGSCDPEWVTSVCPTGQWCRSTATRQNGACVMPTMEMEDNNNVSMPQMVTAPASISGSLTRFDLDCYRVAATAGQAIYARVNYPNGRCLGDAMVTQLALDLYDTNGRLLGGDTNSGVGGCPRIDGASMLMHQSWARATAAGNYTVCVRNNAQGRAAIAGYVVDINVQ